jgi:hypothetical protein
MFCIKSFKEKLLFIQGGSVSFALPLDKMSEQHECDGVIDKNRDSNQGNWEKK